MPPNQSSIQMDARSDGRRDRTEATRQKILAAGRQLIMTGKGEPTAKDIAQQVGMTTRTLFRHFPDMSNLLGTIMADAQTQAQAVMDEPFPSDLSPSEHWRELLSFVIARRTRTYESLLPLHISPTIQRHWRTTAATAIHQGVQRRRKRLTEILPKQMVSDPLLFEALDATLSIEFWISLRVDQDLSIAKAAVVLQYTVDRLVGGMGEARRALRV